MYSVGKTHGIITIPELLSSLCQLHDTKITKYGMNQTTAMMQPNLHCNLPL